MRKIILTMLVAIGFGLVASAQNRTISGTLKEDNGKAIVNASILAKGTNVGTSSDAEGKFTLSVPDRKSVV